MSSRIEQKANEIQTFLNKAEESANGIQGLFSVGVPEPHTRLFSAEEIGEIDTKVEVFIELLRNVDPDHADSGDVIHMARQLLDEVKKAAEKANPGAPTSTTSMVARNPTVWTHQGRYRTGPYLETWQAASRLEGTWRVLNEAIEGLVHRRASAAARRLRPAVTPCGSTPTPPSGAGAVASYIRDNWPKAKGDAERVATLAGARAEAFKNDGVLDPSEAAVIYHTGMSVTGDRGQEGVRAAVADLAPNLLACEDEE